MIIKRISNYSEIVRVIFLTIAVVFSGCAVNLISKYDETTDKTVTALQKKIEGHLVGLEAVDGLPECKYEQYKQFVVAQSNWRLQSDDKITLKEF